MDNKLDWSRHLLHIAIFYAVVCWGGSMMVADAKRLNRLFRKAGSVVGKELDTLETVAERRRLFIFQVIMDDTNHHSTVRYLTWKAPSVTGSPA